MFYSVCLRFDQAATELFTLGHVTANVTKRGDGKLFGRLLGSVRTQQKQTRFTLMVAVVTRNT